MHAPDQHQELREAIRALCATFPAEYHRRIDEARGYPADFVNALTKAGWMGALIPQEYGGSGLGLTEASVIKSCGLAFPIPADTFSWKRDAAPTFVYETGIAKNKVRPRSSPRCGQA